MQTGFSGQPDRPAGRGPEVEYVLDKDDFAECYLHVTAKAVARADLPVVLDFILAGLLACLGAAALAWMIPLRPEGGGLSWVLLLAALSLLAFAGWLVRRTCRILLARRRGAMRRHVEQLLKIGVLHDGRRDRVVLNPDGFVEFNAYEQIDGGVRVRIDKTTEVSWAAVECIAVVGDYLIVTVRAKGHLFVPRRAFADDGAFALFVETARRYADAFPSRLSPGPRAVAAAPASDAITPRVGEHGPA
jgi:hypothetical protein